MEQSCPATTTALVQSFRNRCFHLSSHRMARTKRRTTRTGTQGSPAPAPEREPSVTPPDSQSTIESQPAAPQEDDKCPACEAQTTQHWNESEKENWVRCDACKTWFHWRCAGEGELDIIDKWFVQLGRSSTTPLSVKCHCDSIGFASRVALPILKG